MAKQLQAIPKMYKIQMSVKFKLFLNFDILNFKLDLQRNFSIYFNETFLNKLYKCRRKENERK